MFKHLEINSFDIYVQDDDCEFDWLGTRKYKVKNENGFICESADISAEKEFEFEFNFSTEKKGTLNMNKINLMINPVSISDKNIVINNVPHMLMIDL